LDKYPKVFEVLTSLPPSRGENDNRIPFLPGIQPPNVLSYKYPFSQKNEIENMIQELLEASLIYPSTNPYSSLVVMILNKEGTWHMCPDFWALNKLTIKDKFPISVIDDLLDELQSSCVFPKLDIHSGYRHIHMKEEYILNTTLKNNEGHYEFLFIHFGLFNAPSTFQSLMNKLLKSYLHNFFLIFFDDILIYSCTWDSNLLHVEKVLHFLQENQLFVKNTKCSFRASDVEYLRHIVSQEGVKVDPKKIKAMKE
jgi:hypothetical protein